MIIKTYYIFTLGCQMNISDSEKIINILDSFGLREASEKSADFIIVNACSVRQKPVDRIWGKLRVWNRINPKAKKILTGCVLASDLKKLQKKFDFCFQIDRLDQLVDYLAPHNHDKKIKIKKYFEAKPKRKGKKIAYVPIMTGCNNYCSYCVVPYTRGGERSRDQKSIVSEVRCQIKRGCGEIMLLGQNVCSYSSQPPATSRQRDKNDFVGLLKKLVKIPGNFKISFMSAHPKDFSDKLIDLIALEPKISKQIHLPVQSGDDQVLKRMNRHYTTKESLELVDKLKKKVRGVRISTDIIVGFPGETRRAFQKTVDFVKKCQFEKAYVSIYSERKGTLAEKKYRNNVSMTEKKRRWLMLEKLINRMSKSKCRISNKILND